MTDDDKYNKTLNNFENTEIKTKEYYDIFRKINTTESYIYYNSVYAINLVCLIGNILK